MSDHHHDEAIPKAPLIMFAALAGATVLLAGATSMGYLERSAVPSEARAATGVAAVSERSLFFRDEADGSVRIEDAVDGKEVARVQPGMGGFVRTTMRSLAKARLAKGIGAETPFVLTLYDNDSLTLSDRETGTSVELGSFGPDNRAAFAALLEDTAA